MNKKWITAFGVLVLAAAPCAQAGVGAGDFETGVSISYSQSKTSINQDNGLGGTCTSDTTTKTGSLGGNVGYFITDMIELKAAVSESKNSTDQSGSCGTTGAGNTSSTVGVFSPGADFVFLGKKGKVAPFVGVAYGKALGDTVGVDTDFYDGHAGIKVFVTERASVEVKLTRFQPTDSAGDGRTELAAGINVYF